jgi:hypothetical protein
VTRLRFSSISRIGPVVFALIVTLSSACLKTEPYAKLSESAEPFRTRFNQDAGHVRVVMLVAPT